MLSQRGQLGQAHHPGKGGAAKLTATHCYEKGPQEEAFQVILNSLQA